MNILTDMIKTTLFTTLFSTILAAIMFPFTYLATDALTHIYSSDCVMKIWLGTHAIAIALVIVPVAMGVEESNYINSRKG